MLSVSKALDIFIAHHRIGSVLSEGPSTYALEPSEKHARMFARFSEFSDNTLPEQQIYEAVEKCVQDKPYARVRKLVDTYLQIQGTMTRKDAINFFMKEHVGTLKLSGEE